MSAAHEIPSPTWRTKVREVLDLPLDLVREFAWADLRAGFIDLRGLDTPTRVLVVVGFALLVGMVGALLFNDTWRAQFNLVALQGGAIGRGTLVPDALLPVSFFWIAVAWAYGLTGALHSHPLVRVAVNLFYLVFAFGWLNLTGALSSTDTPISSGALILVILLAAMFAVPLLFIVRARAHPQPAWEWLAFFVLTAVFFALIQAQGVTSWRQFEIPNIVATLQENLASYASFVAPLVLVAGLNIALFANQAAKWTTEAAHKQLDTNLLALGLAIALSLRVWSIANETLASSSAIGWQNEVLGLGGALGIVLILALAYILARRLARERELKVEPLLAQARRIALLFILGFSAVKLVEFVVIDLTPAIPTGAAWNPIRDGLNAVTVVLVTYLQDPWAVLVAFGAILVGIGVARRGAGEVAMYLMITGGSALWYYVTAPDGWLDVLQSASAARIDLLLVLILLTAALYWLARRTLTRERMTGLLFLTLLTGLVRQTNFISSPFSPFLGFAGIGFVAFGILYDAITVGAWANDESKHFPRVNRIFLYLGYVLLSVMIVNWALAAHDLNNIQELTGSVAWRGMELVGLPLLYTIGAITFAHLIQPAKEIER